MDRPAPPTVRDERPTGYLGRPRPDLRIVELTATGGSSGNVDFAAFVQNYETQPARISITATSDGVGPNAHRPRRSTRQRGTHSRCDHRSPAAARGPRPGVRQRDHAVRPR